MLLVLVALGAVLVIKPSLVREGLQQLGVTPPCWLPGCTDCSACRGEASPPAAGDGPPFADAPVNPMQQQGTLGLDAYADAAEQALADEVKRLDDELPWSEEAIFGRTPGAR